MDTTLALINAAASGLIALVLCCLILSRRVHDGIVIKAGLIAMALGFGSIAMRMLDGLRPDDAVHLARSILMVNAGIAVVIIGYLVRKARAGHAVRRVTDWAELDHQEDHKP